MRIFLTMMLVPYVVTPGKATTLPRHPRPFLGVTDDLVTALRAGESRDGPAPSSICDNTVVQYHGYLPGQGDTRLFYWFFESRHNPRDSPTVIYFQGGPGGSSLFSAVSGNGGPCIVDDIGNNTSINKYSWNTHANVMYFDQPAGVGFSRGPIP
ncbi:hypothetical protein FOZ63_000449, partial [Perkinsus olseni]